MQKLKRKLASKLRNFNGTAVSRSVPAETDEEVEKLRAALEEAEQEAEQLRGIADQVVKLQQALEKASSDFNRVNAVSAAVWC